MEPMDKWITVISHRSHDLGIQFVLNEYLTLMSKAVTSSSQGCIIESLALTLERNILISIVPFTPGISINVNTDIKNQIGSGLSHKHQHGLLQTITLFPLFPLCE